MRRPTRLSRLSNTDDCIRQTNWTHHQNIMQNTVTTIQYLTMSRTDRVQPFFLHHVDMFLIMFAHFFKSFVVIFVIHHQVYCLVLAAKSPILSYYHITTKNTLYKLQILSPSSDWKGRSIILISMGVLHTNMSLSRVNSELKMSH